MKYVVKGTYNWGGFSIQTANGVAEARYRAGCMMQSGNIDETSIIAYRLKDKKRLDISDITGVIEMEV